MTAYYNEIEPSAILWLQAAMDAGYIAPGVIDKRPIQEVTPNDIKGFTQCHFFAGIGGWSIALRMAGWPDDKPVWTGSCPCQPFSTAGRQKGKADERHLWPVWFGLIRESRPASVYGEQVANAITKGWLDSIYDDMEGTGYAIASAVLPACSVGAPHKRDRLWFVAQSKTYDDRGNARELSESHEQQTEQRQRGTCNPKPSSSGIVGNAEHNGQFATKESGSDGQAIQHDAQRKDSPSKSEGAGNSRNVADSGEQGLEGHRESGHVYGQEGRQDTQRHFAEDGLDWLFCPDGKARPVKSGTCLLVDGIPPKLRKAALHGYGNAIAPQVAAEFIKASI